MCRLLVYWGSKPKDLRYFLVDAPNSLIKQSYTDDTGKPNPDGWGMAYYIDNELDIVKMPNPAFEDTHFRFLSRHVQANVFFVHVRRKSYGVVRYENTHPFQKDEWVFMHNGNVPRLDGVKEFLESHTPLDKSFQPQGETDSEYIFMQILNRFNLHQARDVEARFTIVRDLMFDIESIIPREETVKLALNIFLTNGEHFFAYRRNRTLMYTQFPDGWLFATEATDKQHSWHNIGEGTFIIGKQPGDIIFRKARTKSRSTIRQNV